MKMTQHLIRNFSIVLFVAVLFCGCAKKPAEVARPERMTPEAQRAFTMLENHLDRIRSVRAKGTLFAWARGENVTDIAVVAKLPDSVRLETMDAVADVTMAAGSRNGRAWVWLPMQDRIYRGRASRRTLKRLIDVDWNVSDLAHVLAGTIDMRGSDFLLKSGDVDGLFAVRDQPMTIKIDMKRGLPLRVTRYDEKRIPGHVAPLYEVRFENYRDVDGIPFPFQVVAHVPGYGHRIVFAYDHVELNREIDDDIFDAP
jgi:outer membrane lipoprotein-sorting protein